MDPVIAVAPERTPVWVRRLVTVSLAIAVVAAAAIWASGGFELRRDRFSAQPGDEIDAGNLVFTLDSATAQHDSITGQWRVTVLGTVRNPHQQTLAPVTGGSGNLAVSAGPGTTAGVADSVLLGDAYQRAGVPPNDQPIPLSAAFRLDGAYALGSTITCGVFRLTYSDDTILGLGAGPTWNDSGSTRPTAVEVPLTILPNS